MFLTDGSQGSRSWVNVELIHIKEYNIVIFTLCYYTHKTIGDIMFKQILIWSVGAFLLMQTIQIDLPEVPKEIDKSKEMPMPKEIATLMKTSCYDCHSYETNVPWYGHVSPISWEVRSHIKEGRSALNFQEWGNYSEEKKQKIYKGIAKTINLRMPMPMYISMHAEADLSHSQRKEIKLWAKSQIKKEH